jgi:hypothetical protein
MNRIFLAALLAGALPLATACADSTGPENGPAHIVAASLSIDGSTASEIPVPRGEATMHFEAQLAPMDPSLIRGVFVDHTGHGMSGRPGHHSHAMTLHDDGTHGDHTPGDGVYCNEEHFGEMMRQMGAMTSMMEGTHTFSIRVEHMDGTHSAPYELKLKLR